MASSRGHRGYNLKKGLKKLAGTCIKTVKSDL